MTKARIRQLRGAAGENSNLTECLDELERLQSFTRRGQSPDAEPEPLPQKAKPQKGEPDPNVKLFIADWLQSFQQHHETAYLIQREKDFPAIKRLLKVGTVDELLDTARKAWKHPDKFNCKQAATIAGFASRFNDIKIELKTIANAGRPIITQPAGCNL